MDKVQTEISKGNGDFSIPVFDYAQILALCMGFDPKEVATISFVPRDSIIEKFQ
jgi:heterodisulfide reductase subunit B